MTTDMGRPEREAAAENPEPAAILGERPPFQPGLPLPRHSGRQTGLVDVERPLQEGEPPQDGGQQPHEAQPDLGAGRGQGEEEIGTVSEKVQRGREVLRLKSGFLNFFAI